MYKCIIVTQFLLLLLIINEKTKPTTSRSKSTLSLFILLKKCLQINMYKIYLSIYFT